MEQSVYAKKYLLILAILVITTTSLFHGAHLHADIPEQYTTTLQDPQTFAEDTPAVGKWRRHVFTFPTTVGSENPFEVEIDATFTHTQTGKKLTLPGYYAGNGEWKVAFMPTELGEWTYKTSSDDSDLNDKVGSLNCIASNHPGMLKASPINPNKWKYVDGDHISPIGVFTANMLDDASAAEFTEMADFLVEHNIHLLNFRISEHDLAFSDVDAHEMNLELWDRLEQRMEILTERGLGATMMIYTDGPGKPSFGPESDTEKFLVRYMVARLASFAGAQFNTGIDIKEYRDQAWVNWYGEYVQSLDPYGHPTSSRHGAGSGPHVMATQTYNSVGDRTSNIVRLLAAYEFDNTIPTANDDNFAEELDGKKAHTPDDIRRAAWKSLISGGVGFHVRHSELNCFDILKECDKYFNVATLPEELDSEVWLSYVNPFIQEHLTDSTFALMEPEDDLEDKGGGVYALADPARTKVLYFYLGTKDSWNGAGSKFRIKLSALTDTYNAMWFDPRTAEETSAGSLSGGTDYTFTPPNSQDDDWVLLLTSTDAPVNIAPAVSITNPSQDSAFIEDDSVTIAASASDSDGSVSQVEFFVNEQSIGVDSTSPYSVSWQAVAGSHAISVRATDDAGSVAADVVDITVEQKQVEPEVEVFADDPANNVVRSPDVLAAGSTLHVEAEDVIVYSTGYYSIAGSDWVAFSLQGTELASGWLHQSGTADVVIPESAAASSANWVVAYTCSLASGQWDCHNNAWQIERFSISS